MAPPGPRWRAAASATTLGRMPTLRLMLHGHEVAVRVTVPPGDGARGHDAPCDVVLVHGIGVSGRYFGPMVDALAGRARVVVPDLPGFGGSPRPSAPLTIAEHAAVLRALVDALGLVRPVLVGHSMGAQVVTEAAATAGPGEVGGVVLAGPVADPRAPTAGGQGLRLLRDVAHERPRWTAVQVREYLRCGPRWFLATLPHMLDYQVADRLADVGAPVLLVRGAHDPVAPASWLADLAAAAPGAATLVVPRGGHLAQVNGAAELADAVVRLAERSRA